MEDYYRSATSDLAKMPVFSKPYSPPEQWKMDLQYLWTFRDNKAKVEEYYGWVQEDLGLAGAKQLKSAYNDYATHRLEEEMANRTKNRAQEIEVEKHLDAHVINARQRVIDLLNGGRWTPQQYAERKGGSWVYPITASTVPGSPGDILGQQGIDDLRAQWAMERGLW